VLKEEYFVYLCIYRNTSGTCKKNTDNHLECSHSANSWINTKGNFLIINPSSLIIVTTKVVSTTVDLHLIWII